LSPRDPTDETEDPSDQDHGAPHEIPAEDHRDHTGGLGGGDVGGASPHTLSGTPDDDTPGDDTPDGGASDHGSLDDGSLDDEPPAPEGPADDVADTAFDGTDPLITDEFDDREAETGRPSIDPRIRQRRVAIRRSQGRRRLRWIGGAAAAVVLVIGVLGLMHTPWFGAQAVSVTGTHPRTPSAAIVAAAGLGGHPPLISLNAGAVAKRVESLPFIATAHVHKHWPDGVQIAVTERAPVVQMAGPGSSWSLLDGNGRTLQVVPGRVPGLVVYIVHTPTAGIPPAPVGRTLPTSAGPGLAVSRSLPPAFAAQVVSVTVAADGSISMTLSSGINVLFGTDADLTAKYQDIASILAHGTLHATSVIDVTVPESPTVSG
jgi:cell division protein FtsQ